LREAIGVQLTLSQFLQLLGGVAAGCLCKQQGVNCRDNHAFPQSWAEEAYNMQLQAVNQAHLHPGRQACIDLSITIKRW